MTKHKILIPLDGSGLSREILATVDHFFTPENAELVLLQTIEEIKPPRQDLPVDVALSVLVTPQRAAENYRKANPLNRYFEIEDALLYQHREDLDSVARSLQLRGFQTDVEVAVGNPGETILQRSRVGDVDLIAMATHGRSGLSRLLLGSVAEEVLHNAPIPVLLLRPSGV